MMHLTFETKKKDYYLYHLSYGEQYVYMWMSTVFAMTKLMLKEK